MATPQVPVLYLSTENTRPTISIDGVPYEIRTDRDVTLAQLKQIHRIVPVAAILIDQESLTPAEDQQLAACLTDVCDIGVIAPPEVLAKLSAFDKLEAYTVFTALLSKRLVRQSQKTAEAIPSAGTTSSPVSSASMAAPTPTGPQKSRSARSART